MYGLSREYDLDFLYHVQLEQIAFSRYQMIFRFSGSVSISVESHCVVIKSETETEQWRCNRFSNLLSFAKLLELHVLHYEIPGDGSLEISFSDNYKLVIYEEDTPYESYTISAPGQTIVV